MAYEKTTWVNGQAPALDAEHLNKMEQGIADAVSVTPQTLSDEQKAQARSNIEAAPAGIAAYHDYEITVEEGQSIQDAINDLPKFGNGYSAIIIIKGTHTESVTLDGFCGYSFLWMEFDNNSVLNGSIHVSNCNQLQIGPGGSNRWSQNAGNNPALILDQGSLVMFSGVTITTTHVNAIQCNLNSRCVVGGCIITATGTGGFEGALRTYYGSTIRAFDTTISPDTPCGLAAQYSSYIQFNGTNNATTKSVTYAGGKVEDT